MPFLLSFPLTTVTTLYALRRLAVGTVPALVGSLLFSFLPYHFLRGEPHLFLASYFLIPPMVLVLLRVSGGEGLFLRIIAPRWKLRGWPAVAAVATALLMGSGGVYDAFFSCYLLLVAGLSGWWRRRRVEPLLAAALLIEAICLGAAVNLAPKLIYDLRHGPNPEAVIRYPIEAEMYGLRLAHLLLPLNGHRLRPLADLKESYYRAVPSLRAGEGYQVTIGLVASVGFVLLVARLLLRRRSTRPGALDGLAVLNSFALLLALQGGLGGLFNLVVSPWIRCYNRISVFIACFAIFALALVAQEVRTRLAGPRRLVAYYGLLGLVLAAGLLDQTVPSFVPPYDQLRQAYASDHEFIGRIEATVPPGAMVFQFPAIAFPEEAPRNGMGSYEHFRAYLHSRTLRWSHGARLARPHHRLASHAAPGLALVAGVLDKASPAFVPPYERSKRAYDQHADYIGRIEAALPRRAIVFQPPALPFHETSAVGGVGCSDHLRCFLHSRRLRWSHGAMKGRRGDQWQTSLASRPLAEMVEVLAFAGFGGIHINRAG